MKKRNNSELCTIFQEAEKSLFRISKLGHKDFSAVFEPFKNLTVKNRKDNDYFWVLVYVVFYSGFKAKTVTDKIDAIREVFNDYKEVAKYDESKVNEIIESRKIINNKAKIKGLIHNAKQFGQIINDYGSFNSFMSSFGNTDDDENLLKLIKNLQKRFKFLGSITVYHFLTDLGYNVLKPDRVLCRVFYRLGLVDSEEDYSGVIKAGRMFARATNLTIRYIDIVFVIYGQIGSSEEFGLEGGICLTLNPLCELCGMYTYCQYKSKKQLEGKNTISHFTKEIANGTLEEIYIAKFLRDTPWGEPTFKELTANLENKGYTIKLIENNRNNEWCRDYMPIIASDGSLVKFKYEPIYLTETKKWSKTIPDVSEILSDLNIKVSESSDLKLDGGAIEIYGTTGIISNRVIIENQPLSEVEICDIIKEKLILERVVIIPIHPDDYTGHVDGAIRFVSENLVIINDDREALKNLAALHAYKRQAVEQFYYSLRMSLYNAGINWKYLSYVEGKQKDNSDPDNNFNLYMNFLHLKELIVMPSYGTPEYDNQAQDQLAELFKKEVIQVNALALSKKGGMINCVTWDLPG